MERDLLRRVKASRLKSVTNRDDTFTILQIGYFYGLYSARFDRLLVSDLIGFLSTTQASTFNSLLFSCLFLTCNRTDTHLLVSTKMSLGVNWFGGTYGVY